MTSPVFSLISRAIGTSTACALLFISSSLHAADYTWTGSANNNWNGTTNWAPNVSNGPLATDNIVGSTTGVQLNINGTARTIANFSYSGTNWTVLGNSGTTMNITGTLTRGGSSGTLTFRQGNSTTQELNLNVGNVVVSGGNLDLGINGASTGGLNTLNVSNSTTVTGGELRINSVANYTLGRLQVTGGSVTLNNRPGDALKGVTVNGITGTSAGGTIRGTYAGNSSTTNLLISNTVAASTAATFIDGGNSSSRLNITKSGTASQTFLSASTYSGSTVVLEGTLDAANANAFGTSSLTISGTGNVLSSVANLNVASATLNSANASLNIGGSSSSDSLTISSGNDFVMSAGTLFISYDGSADQIIGSGAGSEFLLTGGTISLSNSLWDYSQTYAIFSGFSSGNVSGITFTDYNSAGYTAFLSNSGVLSFDAVPEPSTYALLALGGLAVAGWKRLRRK